MEADISERIRSDFPPGDASEALRILEAAGTSGRVGRCIVVASTGNLEDLRRYVAMADLDPRDVIAAGEHDMPMQKRDFRVSFLIDSPEKFWIGSIAAALFDRGYTLRSLQSRLASGGSSDFTADRGEGVAEFDGTPVPITIEKSDGRFTLHGDPDELKLYDLDRPFDNELAFRDAVSCYLLAKQRPYKKLDTKT
jgi:hypothetical protein